MGLTWVQEIYSSLYVGVQANITKSYKTVFSLAVAALLSLWYKLYVRPVVVLGSTRVKILDKGSVMISGAVGYLYERLGPCGWRNVSHFKDLSPTRMPTTIRFRAYRLHTLILAQFPNPQVVLLPFHLLNRLMMNTSLSIKCHMILEWRCVSYVFPV